MARVRFDGFLKDLLLLELRSIARARAVIGDGASVIRVIDSSVFIAKFRVTAALQAARTGLKAAITAFEANSALADPIRTHLALLGGRSRCMPTASALARHAPVFPFRGQADRRHAVHAHPQGRCRPRCHHPLLRVHPAA